MIRGYPRRASVAPGERLVLHVACSSARFRVRFYRWGDGLVPMDESAWLTATDAPARGPDEDWGWPAYEFAIPADWPSAVYIAYLEEPGGVPVHLALDSAAALFVVRGAARGGMLYKLPLATYHAYNYSGGGCYYANPPHSADPPGARVSLLRPGGGIGGDIWGAPDHHDPSSPRQSFAHWDARVIGWLARHGYAPQFCTDFDIHADPGVLDGQRLLVSVGHDEYWSEPARDAVEAFVGGGGNVAFFAGNLCWWRIHMVEDGTAMVCHQGGPGGARDLWWSPTGAARPEDSLGGSSYRHGGGWWDGPRACAGYLVQQPEHWAFAGTGLARGQAFGQHSTPPLIGYECDGAPLDAFDHASGVATLSATASAHGTPAGYELLAACPLDERWQERPARAGFAAGAGVHAATMGVFTRNGTVFSAGTTDWAQVLDGGSEPVLERITSNVLNHLLRP
jgi:hypothetical protein